MLNRVVEYEVHSEFLTGDMMMSLNKIHHHAWINDTTAHVIWKWPCGKYEKYRSKDIDLGWERVNFIHKHYYQSERVTIEHRFNQHIGSLFQDHIRRFGKKVDFIECDDWLFDPKWKKEPEEDKVVVWDWTTNAKPPKRWKRQVDCWPDIYKTLRLSFNKVVRIDYQTPIKEAFDHINTAKLCVSYEGNWHYISRNFGKPHIVTCVSGNTSFHTPQAIQVGTNEHTLAILNNIPDYVYSKADRYWNKTIKKFTE